jgi:hypothetical protein
VIKNKSVPFLPKRKGYVPDIVSAHPGWGESLFVKEVWPDAKLGIYCEFFYAPQGADTGFDPEFASGDPGGDACRTRIKNVNNLVHFETADAGLSPTLWQASTFPERFRQKITVVHDGIDTKHLIPWPGAGRYHVEGYFSQRGQRPAGYEPGAFSGVSVL